MQASFKLLILDAVATSIYSTDWPNGISETPAGLHTTRQKKKRV